VRKTMLTGIALFYLVCLGVGFLFALLGAIFGELAGHFNFDIGGHEIGVDHGMGVGEPAIAVGHELGAGHEIAPGHGIAGVGHDMPGASLFNTITLSTFLAFFGIAGLGGTWGLGLRPLASVAFALPTAMLIAGGQFALFVKVFVKAQASSEATMSEVLGCEADVLTGIPADRMGQIGYVIKGSHYNAPAVSEDGKDIARGTRVYIVNVKDNAFVVRPL
jgi:membrane protein implicated in regulation of membrane protease activity